MKASSVVVLCLLFASSLMLYSVQTVSAVSTVVFTTTADFDGGNKSDPGMSWFADNGVDIPTYSFITQPQAMYSAAFDRTYVTYFGAANGSVYVTFYDHGDDSWLSPRWLTQTGGGTDGHENPSIYVTTSGRIVLACCGHDNALSFYRTTTTDGSISSWEAATSPTTVGTYPNLIEYPVGTVWIFYRNAAAAGGDFTYKKTTDYGTTWSVDTSFIDMGADGIYWGKWDIENDRLYIPWVKYNFTGSGQRQDVFVCYMDLDTGNGFSVVGTDLGTQITSAEANASCRVVHQTGTTINNIPSLDVLTSTIYLLYTEAASPFDDLDFETLAMVYSGSWSSPVTIAVSGADSSYFDVRAISSTSAEAFIVTPGYQTGCAGNCEFTGDLERWTWNGSSWTLAETILLEREAGRPVNFPYVPFMWAEPVRVVFAEFAQIDFIPTSDAPRPAGTQHLYAWGSSGFVGIEAKATGAFGVETSTDNQNVAQGGFRLAGADADNFSRAVTSSFAFGESSFKWPSIASQGNSGLSCNRTVSGATGIYNITQTTNAASECWAVSRSTISGEFDFRLKFDRTHGVKTYGLCWLDVPFECHRTQHGAYPSTADGVVYDNLDAQLIAFRVNAGVLTQIGLTTINANDPLWLRLSRTGVDTFTFLWSTDGTSWTTDESASVASMPSAAFPGFYSYSNGVTYGTPMLEVDSFLITSGTFDDSTFRKNADWVSTIQTATPPDVPTTVTVEYSGASSSGYIDAVAIVDINGNVLQQDGTDRTSGTSFTWNVPSTGLAGEDWSVRVSLAGDGTISAIVESVTVNLDTVPCFATSTIGEIILDLFPVFVGLGLLALALVVFVAVRSGNISAMKTNKSLGNVVIIIVGFIVVAIITSVIVGSTLQIGGSLGC